jgi:hypothetical protein
VNSAQKSSLNDLIAPWNDAESTPGFQCWLQPRRAWLSNLLISQNCSIRWSSEDYRLILKRSGEMPQCWMHFVLIFYFGELRDGLINAQSISNEWNAPDSWTWYQVQFSSTNTTSPTRTFDELSRCARWPNFDGFDKERPNHSYSLCVDIVFLQVLEVSNGIFVKFLQLLFRVKRWFATTRKLRGSASMRSLRLCRCASSILK